MLKAGMGEAIGWAYSVGPIAAILSPFLLGMLADRFFRDRTDSWVAAHCGRDSVVLRADGSKGC